MNSTLSELQSTTKWDLSQVYKGGSRFENQLMLIHRINRLKNKNCMIITIDAEKAFDKIQQLIHHKNSLKTRNKSELSLLDKEYLLKVYS